jgi:hypothetical protein
LVEERRIERRYKIFQTSLVEFAISKIINYLWIYCGLRNNKEEVGNEDWDVNHPIAFYLMVPQSSLKSVKRTCGLLCSYCRDDWKGSSSQEKEVYLSEDPVEQLNLTCQF